MAALCRTGMPDSACIAPSLRREKAIQLNGSTPNELSAFEGSILSDASKGSVDLPLSQDGVKENTYANYGVG